MITLKIGTSERQNDEIDAKWITHQINSRKLNDKPFCVKFKISCGDNNLNLAAGDCPSGGGGGASRQFTRLEERLIDEWRKKGFTERTINPGMVVSFWQFANRACG